MRKFCWGGGSYSLKSSDLSGNVRTVVREKVMERRNGAVNCSVLIPGTAGCLFNKS